MNILSMAAALILATILSACNSDSNSKAASVSNVDPVSNSDATSVSDADADSNSNNSADTDTLTPSMRLTQAAIEHIMTEITIDTARVNAQTSKTNNGRTTQTFRTTQTQWYELDDTCSEGSAKFTEVDDKFKVHYDQCIPIELTSDHPNLLTKFNGFFYLPMQTENTLLETLWYENFVTTIYNNNQFYNRQINGEQTQIYVDEAQFRQHTWDYWIDISTNLPNVPTGSVHIQSLTPLESYADNDLLISGSFRIEGSDKTYADVTIISNGLEVSTNGTQPVLYTWNTLTHLYTEFYARFEE